MKRFLRKIRYGAPVIVVSGLPRSGTSMAMQMLAAAGVDIVTDGVRQAGEDNPKGYFEDERVKDLHDDGHDRGWLTQSRGKAVKIVSFFLKDLPKDNNYKILFMRRELPEVLRSQEKMLERRGEPSDTSDEKMLEIWKDHLWRVNYLLKHSDHLEALELVYHDVVNEPLAQARRIGAFLGGGLDVDKMAGAVDGSLYRNRS